ncbi:MAG: phage baseplate plug family protein [Phycisphaeraceae bacterium]
MADFALLGPKRTERPAFRFRTLLDGTIYGFRFVWNSRLFRWYFDLADSAGNTIASGIAIVTGADLLAAIPNGPGPNNDPKPPGQLYVVDDSGAGRLPTRNGWRSDFRMIYRDAAGVLEAAGTADEVR